ncbi:putative glycolipid-binding domain-containing protein [Amycolatopsis sp. NPDC058340]|uniref:putative glycolipid-binding domain-containing protein n=1 Tax=Amycolatopsis sp. NPDC058340 TaxID=3346453 RepID=UPI003666D7D6
MSLPTTASWLHRDARTGLEVAFFREHDGGWRISGATTAVEDGESWFVEYAITVDAAWRTRSAEISGRSASGARRTVLESVGDGRWRVDGVADPRLDGCFDVDLESSSMTNTLPVHRLGLAAGAAAEAPAVYVRAGDLAVERLEQRYERVCDHDFAYAAPVFDFSCVLRYDRYLLVRDYPGLAVRLS